MHTLEIHRLSGTLHIMNRFISGTWDSLSGQSPVADCPMLVTYNMQTHDYYADARLLYSLLSCSAHTYIYIYIYREKGKKTRNRCNLIFLWATPIVAAIGLATPGLHIFIYIYLYIQKRNIYMLLDPLYVIMIRRRNNKSMYTSSSLSNLSRAAWAQR